MTPANLLMFGLGVIAALVGVVLLTRRGGSEPAKVARRIAGTMALALGIILALFALGLSGMAAEPAHA